MSFPSEIDKVDHDSSMESLLQFERQLFQKEPKPVVTSSATASPLATFTTSLASMKRPTLEESSALKIMRTDGQSCAMTSFSSSSGTSNLISSSNILSAVFKTPNAVSTSSSTEPTMSAKTSNHLATIIAGASNGTPIAIGIISEPKVTIPSTVLNLPTSSSAPTGPQNQPKPSKRLSTTELFRSINSKPMLVVSNLVIKQEPEEELTNQLVTQSNAEQTGRSAHQDSAPKTTLPITLNDINIDDLSSRLSDTETYTISKADLLDLLQASRKSAIPEPWSLPNAVQPSNASKANFRIFITFNQIDHYVMNFHNENNRPRFDLFIAELKQILLIDRQLACPIVNVYVHGSTEIRVRVFNETSLVSMFTDQSVYLYNVRHSNGTNANEPNSVDVFLRPKPKTSFI